jgi:hypothetical protein
MLMANRRVGFIAALELSGQDGYKIKKNQLLTQTSRF